MKDDGKETNVFITSTPTGESSWFSAYVDHLKNKPMFMGIDWCAGHGNIRGEVIKKKGNVTHVRFKTVSI